MSKLTAKEIDDRSMRAMNSFQRAYELGEIDRKTYDSNIKELATWAIHHYSKLPQVQAMDALLGLLQSLDIKTERILDLPLKCRHRDDGRGRCIDCDEFI